MFSDSRYSLTRYSLNREGRTVEVSEAFTETMEALAGAAVPVDFQGNYGETCRGSVRGTVSVISTLSGLERLSAQARMSADVIMGVCLAEAFHADAYGQKNMPAALAVQEALDAALWASKDIHTGLEMAGALSAQTAGSKNVPAALSAASVLTTLTEAISQTTKRAVFQLTIPPGGELRVDSELFTVLLNGQNALHTQSGDWIDISREVLRLTVESASGGKLEGQLIYTERYL